MSLWTSCVLGILLVQTVYSQTAQSEVGLDSPIIIEEVANHSEHLPNRLVVSKKDWDLKRAYADAFQILSSDNKCSSFYGGPQVATTVLNRFVALIKAEPLVPEISFQMGGKKTLVNIRATGMWYRLFDKITVNSKGSFYQRRQDMHLLPADVGSFRPGTRPARVLILLHELGHLILNENGYWLLPDDGYDGSKSKANTFVIQQACRMELEELK